MNTTISVKTKIRFNGQEYASAEEMPANARQAYERALALMASDRQSGLASKLGAGITHTKIVVNGQEFTSADEMPPDLRRIYDDAMASVDKNRDGIPDALQTTRPAPLALQSSSNTSAITTSVTIGGLQPESTTGRLLIAAVVVAALLLVGFVFGR